MNPRSRRCARWRRLLALSTLALGLAPSPLAADAAPTQPTDSAMTAEERSLRILELERSLAEIREQLLVVIGQPVEGDALTAAERRQLRAAAAALAEAGAELRALRGRGEPRPPLPSSQ